MAHRLCCTTAMLLLLALLGAQSAAAAPVPLGTAANFAVLGGSTVTNTGPTVITGDLGLSPGTSVTGFPPGTVNGTMHITDSAAAQAQSDLTTAYNDAAGRSPTSTITADLAGRTLVPGVYNSGSSIGLSGDLTLDAQGDPAAVFVFQAGSALTTGSASRVLLRNGAQACNVFWQVGSSATLGTNSTFAGNVLALTSISVTTGANVTGSVLTRNGAVTLDTNNVTRSACAAPGTTPAPGGTGTATDTDGDGTPDSVDSTPTGAAGTPGAGVPGAVAPGTPATIAGPPRCVKAPFWARVRGGSIASVTFAVDGRPRATLHAKPGRTVFVLLIKPMEQSRTTHRITARVRFTAASGRKARTLRLVYKRCGGVAAAVTPGFTG
jgi:hypothetical protein